MKTASQINYELEKCKSAHYDAIDALMLLRGRFITPNQVASIKSKIDKHYSKLEKEIINQAS